MPGFDRTGPAGAGPMTGGRRGLCARPGTADAPAGYGGFGYGRGMGFRRGGGGGFGAGWCRRPGFGRRYRDYGEGWRGDGPASRQEEMALLKADAEAMKRSLDAIQKRIEELGQAESSD